MQNYLIEPLAPLVFRSGKPFGAAAGADGNNFPLPSSSAGLLRTVAADQTKQAFSVALKQQVCRGPLLVKYEDAKSLTILVPKPANAMYMKGQDNVVRLSPQAFDNTECGSDLPTGLLPVQMQSSIKGKPASGTQYWSLQHVISWQAGKSLTVEDVKKEGLASLPSEQRTHVALDDVSLSSDYGRLFQTAGLAMQAPKHQKTDEDANKTDNDKKGWSNEQLGFLLQTDKTLSNDLVTFGGERRLSRLHKLEATATGLKPNQQLSAEVRKSKGLCLTLLTPAIFAQGYLPAWINPNTLQGHLPQLPSLELKLRAVAIDRWLPVSGWDLAQWKPKAMRKAVAAGAVYWFEIIGDVPNNLHETLWLTAIADDAQDQRDGFGLVLPTAWQAK